MRQKTRNILLGAAALFGALTCAHRAGAAFICTDAAAFDAALDRVHVETFESMATGADVFTLPNRLTEMGFVVATLGARGGQGRGTRFAHALYRRVGSVDVDDSSRP